LPSHDSMSVSSSSSIQAPLPSHSSGCQWPVLVSGEKRKFPFPTNICAIRSGCLQSPQMASSAHLTPATKHSCSIRNRSCQLPRPASSWRGVILYFSPLWSCLLHIERLQMAGAPLPSTQVFREVEISLHRKSVHCIYVNGVS
jgi:hypothetical protein